MGTKEKLIARFSTLPSDFTWEEMRRLLVALGYVPGNKGKTSGEGVFGLQRGFKLAGANTLLMSLWKVDDTATQKLMAEFYRHYLSGKSKQESLNLAQQSLRNNSEYSDPEYWAAFILLDGLN